MKDLLPPDLAVLRALVRCELTADDRRAVESWLVRHADDRVASALDALAAEWRELQLDQRLAEPWRSISNAFWPLAELGFAVLDPEPVLPRPSLLRRAVLPATGMFELSLVDRERRDIRVRGPAISASETLYATNDAGELHVLAHTEVDYRCEPREGRTTFWAIDGGHVSSSPAALYEALASTHASKGVRALRITPSFFDR